MWRQVFISKCYRFIFFTFLKRSRKWKLMLIILSVKVRPARGGARIHEGAHPQWSARGTRNLAGLHEGHGQGHHAWGMSINIRFLCFRGFPIGLISILLWNLCHRVKLLNFHKKQKQKWTITSFILCVCVWKY